MYHVVLYIDDDLLYIDESSDLKTKCRSLII